MDVSLPLSPAPKEAYISQKLKAFMSEPQGSALVSALEGQFSCQISVVNDALVVNGAQADIAQIENILRDVWQKRDIQIMIREAALNVSCSHTCQMILPRAYCAVVFFFSSDFQRRSRCNDIIIDQFTGKVSFFGTEFTVNKAREVMIECLVEHFGLLEVDIPNARQTRRIGYGLAAGVFNPEVTSPPISTSSPPFINNVYAMGEPNAILTSTPPPCIDEHLLSSNFESQMLFPSDFSVPPPSLSSVQEALNLPQKTNNVEKIKQWIPTAEVGKILGNRAAIKKQIEGQFNCVITVHTEVHSQFGMTSVEIMAQNKDQCLGARDAVLFQMQSYQEKPSSNLPFTDSGINSPSSPLTESPSTTPEKRSGTRQYHRSNFRDQPKVMLALSPRKLHISNE